MRRSVPDVVIRAGGQRLASDTTIATVGRQVVVLATAVPELALTVTTVYVGAVDVATVAVDLALGRRPDATNRTRELERDAVPVTHAHDRCLLDHAAQVRDEVAAVTAGAEVEIGDAALASLAS